MTADSELLTLDEVAAQVKVAKSVVERWVYEELSLASFKKDRVRRVLRSDLVKFVLMNTLKPRRPEWLTAQVESDFEKKLRDIVRAEVKTVLQPA